MIVQLREEQRGIVARHGAGFGRAAMAEMRYADAVAREVLRIWGPAKVLFRCAHPQPCLLGGGAKCWGSRTI